MSSPIDLKNPGRPIHVGVLLLNSRTEILDVAPIDMCFGLSKTLAMGMPDEFCPPHLKEQALDVEFHWVSESGGLMPLTSGARVQATNSFSDCPTLDVVLMGAHDALAYQPTEAELAFIRESYEHCAAFLCICAGMLAPLQAGIFHGKTATAPREMIPQLLEQAPNVKWVAKRWANDEKLWTSGTLLNGQDMMTAFAQHTWGSKSADGKPLELAEYVIELGAWPVRDAEY